MVVISAMTTPLMPPHGPCRWLLGRSQEGLHLVQADERVLDLFAAQRFALARLVVLAPRTLHRCCDARCVPFTILTLDGKGEALPFCVGHGRELDLSQW